MLPDLGVLAATLIGCGLGGAVLLLITGIVGVDNSLARPTPRWKRAVERLSQPGLSRRITVGMLAGAAVLVLTRWPVAAVGVAVLIGQWPSMFGGAHAERARIQRLEALVIWTESLRDTVAAHASLERAIPASTDHAPALIRPALVRLAGQIRVRTPLDAALRSLATDLDDPSADLVIAALILNVRRRGDQLADVLTGLAVAAREELDMQRKVSAGRAGLRRGVQIVVGLTLAFAVYLTVFSRAYVQPYSTPAGQVALAVVIGLFAAGFIWMRQLSAGQAVQPFLSRPGATMTPDDTAVVAGLTGFTPVRTRELSTERRTAR